MTNPQRHSEQNPYTSATYLNELIQAANRILNDVDPSAVKGTGLFALMDVIGERADDLSRELSRDEFDGDWQKRRERLSPKA